MFSTVQGIPKADHQIVTASLPTEMPASDRMALGSRQIAAVSFVILTMLALVASVAYLAGRMVTPVIATATESKPAPGPAPEQLYVVEAGQTAVVQPTTAPAVIPATPTAAQPPVSIPSPTVANMLPAPGTQAISRPIPDAAPVPAAPAFRLAYFQVASVDRGMADVSVEYLKKNSLPAFAAPGATPMLYRVMVGPATSPEEAARFKGTLLKLGFTPFSKRL